MNTYTYYAKFVLSTDERATSQRKSEGYAWSSGDFPLSPDNEADVNEMEKIIEECYRKACGEDFVRVKIRSFNQIALTIH